MSKKWRTLKKIDEQIKIKQKEYTETEKEYNRLKSQWEKAGWDEEIAKELKISSSVRSKYRKFQRLEELLEDPIGWGPRWKVKWNASGGRPGYGKGDNSHWKEWQEENDRWES